MSAKSPPQIWYILRILAFLFQLCSAELFGQLIALGYKNVRINETLLFQRGQHLILTGKFRYLFVQLNDIQAPEHSAVADRQETGDHLGEDWLSMVLEVIVS